MTETLTGNSSDLKTFHNKVISQRIHLQIFTDILNRINVYYLPIIFPVPFIGMFIITIIVFSSCFFVLFIL